jgi:hypothetical protein
MFDSPLRRHLSKRVGLRGTLLNLLVTIVRLSQNEDGRCWARECFLGQCIERAARTVRATIAKLRALGLVRTRTTGRNLICTPVWEALGLAPRGDAKPAPATASEPQTPACPEPANETPAHDDDAEVHPDLAAPEIAAPVPEDPAPTHAEAALPQVRDRFGVEAERDVADVLESDPHATPDAARLALDRLLAVEPERVQRSVGGYFRRLLELASTGRLTSPSPCTPPSSGCAPDPIDHAVNTQAAHVHALKQDLERADLGSDQHRQLTHALHAAIDTLIRLRAQQDARGRPPVAPPPNTAPPPPRRRTGPLPERLAELLATREASAPT